MDKAKNAESLWRLVLALALAVLVWLPNAAYANGTGELVVFHTNDMHARILKGDDNGSSIGLAEIAAAVKSVRAKNPATLWLDAGDTLHGMPRINVSKGENIIPLLNQSGMNVLVPGNHDFNYGFRQLVNLSKKLNFPVLSANTVYKSNHKNAFASYKIYKLADGIKVGVFGLTTPEAAFKTSPSNVTEVEFLNPVDKSRKMIKKLRPKCDVVIAVMHMGVDASSEFTSERIARETDGIDLIVDGHSHTALPDGLIVKNTLIVQTGWHEYKLGEVKIDIKDHRITGKKAQLLDADKVQELAPVPDPVISKTLADMEAANEKLFGEVVAHSECALTSKRLIVRRKEAELGNLCADAFRWRTGADIAVINGGGMRADLPEGDVTRGACLAIFPFGNTVQMAEVKGAVVREMLEHSVYGYPVSFGGFLDVSGVTFTFDATKSVGERIVEVKVNGELLDDNKTYTLASNDFLFSGGDDYEMLKDAKIVGEFNTCEEILADYINTVGMKNIETGRITIVNDVPLPDEAADGDEVNYAEAA